MREVRMTFGEHLEELRTRILWAVLWLTIGVIVCFIYGKGLLKWTMHPHEIAIRSAVRERSISILQTKGNDLLSLLQEGSASLPREGERSVWELLFAADVAREKLASRLSDCVRTWGKDADLGVEPERRERALASLDSLVRSMAGAIAEGMTADNATAGSASLPSRFRLLEEDLRQTASRMGTSTVKSLIGLGQSMGDGIVPLEKANAFLDERRRAVLEAPASALVRGPAPASPEETGFLRKIEALYDDLRAQAKILREDEGKPPIAISYLESFMTYFKVSLVFGLFFSIPLILYEMWKFVGAGLYPNEQRYVLIFLPFSIALFFGGAMFGYLSVIPVALSFLAGWGSDMVEMSFTLSNYVGLFFTLTVLLGLTFETPLVMIFLGKIGIVDGKGFRKVRKWAILGSVVFAALVTPPDPLSWSLVAVPMILLYELGILLVDFGARKKAKAEKSTVDSRQSEEAVK